MFAVSAYNNSYHATIKMTPYEALFGRIPVLVSDLILSHQLPSKTKLSEVSDFVKSLRIQAEFINQMIVENTFEAKARQKENYDRFVKSNAEF